jgi:magnesium chelatase subunit D
VTRAELAARLLAIDPAGLGGVRLRGGGPERDRAVELLRTLLPVRRLPASIDHDRLTGGLDLGATLALGTAVLRPGLLAEADGGALLVTGAERLPDPLGGAIAAVMDVGCIMTRHDGAELSAPACFALLLLDDGASEEERPPPTLLERVGLWVDCGGDGGAAAVAATAALAPSAVALPADAQLTALAGTAAALGVGSARALSFALNAARAHAALHGRTEMTDADLVVAAELVLGPRATQLPPDSEQPPADEPPPDRPPPSPEEPGDGEQTSEPTPEELAELVLAAAQAAVPGDLLARLAEGALRGPPPRARGAGERRRAPSRGRPAGERAGMPRGGARLALMATLRAAAPWQRVRSDASRAAAGPAPAPKLHIRREDLRVKRFVSRAETTTIFAVDASGSSAAARLAEAKGAVEILLAQAHVTRAEVALLAFRGEGAELLLPPTRSLTRARRALAELPGGGPTPLAAGLDAALALAASARAKNRTPQLVVLTDGRANVARGGAHGRAAATADAEAAARRIAASATPAVVIDISPRAQPEAAALAAAMRARYLALPRAGAERLSAALGA